MPSEQPEQLLPKSASEMLGHLIGLRFAITELLGELAIDVIAQNPRTVFMAIKGLEAQATEVVRIAKGEITG